MKEFLKSYGGTVAVVLGTLVVLSFVIGYLPTAIQNRLPKY